ncbi:MAG: DUF6758 family protein [Kineosporiaceae bacterium]
MVASSAAMRCPRCGAQARPPGLWSDVWSCAEHGEVAPLHAAVAASPEALRAGAARSQVPVWLPWPLPQGWLATGLMLAGDEHTGPRAAVVACSGPNPLPPSLHDDPEEAPASRVAELLLVAEQPGIGLAAHLAGLDGVDAGAAVGGGGPHMKLHAAGHDVPLWCAGADGCAAYVGEADGVWLWALIWPSRAAAVMMEDFSLVDLRDPGYTLDIPCGALSPRLQ